MYVIIEIHIPHKLLKNYTAAVQNAPQLRFEYIFFNKDKIKSKVFFS